MSDTESQQDGDDWSRVWRARIAGLETIFGLPSRTVLHASVPIQLGGFADVLQFPEFTSGMTYVTADLTGQDVGQRPNSLGNYELVICTQHELPKAASLISKLARYTCDCVLEPGHTMDLPGYFGDESIRALLFSSLRDVPVGFSFLGKQHGLLLAMGITIEELEFGRAHGNGELLTMLKEGGVFPYTIPGRASVSLWSK